MAGPAKTTSGMINVRIRKGSALERIVTGRSATETLHVMADLIEAAPPAVAAQLPAREGGEIDPATLVAPKLGPLPSHIVVEPKTERVYQIGHDEHTAQVVTESQLLDLAREQYPAGLVPVGVDEDDVIRDDELLDATGGDQQLVADDNQDEDLSFLA